MNLALHSTRRRLLGVSVMIGLVGGMSLIAAAAPAQAVPGATVVSVPSVADSGAKSVTAFCPAGTVLFGASGRIVNGGGKVLITDMVPDDVTDSVRVQGAENDMYGPNWRVIATAICAPDGGHNMNVIEQPSVVDGTNVAPRSTFPACQNNQTVFGTGFKITGADGNVTIAEVEPDAGLTQVEVEARADNGFTGVFDLSGYVICGDLNGSTVTLTTQASAFGMAANYDAQTPPCPAGATITGVGGKVTDGVDGILLDRFEVNVSLNRANITAWDNAMAGIPYEGIAFGICAD